jgi:hypothetical protein
LGNEGQIKKAEPFADPASLFDCSIPDKTSGLLSIKVNFVGIVGAY